MLGVHQFKISKNKSCYFVERAFGNYLVFADSYSDFDYDFFHAKGGLYKQFFESFSNIREVHGKLFNRLGANAVLHSQKELFHEELPIERYGMEFEDPLIKFSSLGTLKWLRFKQGDGGVVIFGAEFYLSGRGNILQEGEDKTSEWMMYFEEHAVTYAFFSHYETEGLLLLKKKKWWEKIFGI